MKKIILISVLICFCGVLSAQTISCGVAMSEKLQKEKFDSTISYHLRKKDYKLDSKGIIIPVVVHIVWQNDNENLSDALILSQIDALNRDFTGLDDISMIKNNDGIVFRQKIVKE